ncbi:putative DNA modification/repair radical SAM protein [Bdellovibrio sp. SKB1291214]|uniref:putative DNA modification/repair radical SAM protein n=1 Tax=Bdellovibrio sp. SKB1291214 TaxID=1732569 RepID=UPI000B5172E7|nr:putative DNA modification/repair radical SAM protein [Bdellovibrio sp. SKB1291214]UYL07241.1 putative DNA modification/repair radical SAM protein [Bdellovibrio sp. SKB1291214]
MTIKWDVLKSKLAILADAAKYDASCSSSGSQRKRENGGMGNVEGMGICHSYAPDGRCISLLKILMTNFCIFDCKYCVNRVSSDVKRARFTPEEIVQLTLEFYRRNYIEGLFLSSGIINSSDETMELLIQVAKSLRIEHKFQGYIHLKVVAGSSQELILKAGLWADRVSANIEMPVQEDLNALAPAKTIKEATTSMDQIATRVEEAKEDQKKFFKAPRFAPAGQTTQMIVGATESTDSVILHQSQDLYKKYSLRRVYYSAYSPIPHADAFLPRGEPSLVRENRLYQADWLVRFYKFDAKELTSTDAPNLPLDIDPKTAWALRNRHAFPVNVNTASREELLRVPGFGVKNVERILQMRPFRRITLLDIGKLRIPLKRAKYFIITQDHNPDVYLVDANDLKERIKPEDKQLSLFDVKLSAVSGDL